MAHPTHCGLPQVTLALRLLTYVSLFKVLGPLLVTVLSMVSDAARFSGVLIIVIFGWANGAYAPTPHLHHMHPSHPARAPRACTPRGVTPHAHHHMRAALAGFYSLIHSNTPSAELAAMPFDYSYFNILSEMLIWLTGQATVELMAPLSPNIQFGANILFWTFLATAYFVLLNLLIAIFNSAYERVISNSIPEWLFIRLNTLLEFESDIAQPGVRAYYKQLQTRDGQRAMAYKRDDD